MRAALLAFALLVLGGTPLLAQAPRRVVTVNLCLDQLALRLAAPGQLVGVSYLAHDPRLSMLAERARDVPSVRARVEPILELRPDLVIFDSSMHASLKHLVRRAGVPLLELPWAASLEEAEALIGRIAGALGREAEGRALAAGMRRERQRLAWPGPARGTAVALQANHGTSGKGSLLDELLRLAGFRNLAAELGIPGYGRLSLEQVLAGQPDLVVLDGEANAHPARATEFIDNHALASLAPRTRLLSMPLRYSICAGPENLEALRLLAGTAP
jgi:iron complex transport system substrate-binding protein